LAPQDLVPDEVVLGPTIVRVTSAIDLDYQPPSEADEVEDVSAERCLPAEAIALLAQALQLRPQHGFGPTRIVAKQARASDCRIHPGRMFYICSRRKKSGRQGLCGVGLPHPARLWRAVPPH
jgi:hypothetical protein